jgi:hypothetical protein
MDDVLREDTEDSILELDHFVGRPAMSTYRMRRSRNPMSDRFLEGIEEKLTKAEKRSYAKEWGDANDVTANPRPSS